MKAAAASGRLATSLELMKASLFAIKWPVSNRARNGRVARIVMWRYRNGELVGENA